MSWSSFANETFAPLLISTAFRCFVDMANHCNFSGSNQVRYLPAGDIRALALTFSATISFSPVLRSTRYRSLKPGVSHESICLYFSLEVPTATSAFDRASVSTVGISFVASCRIFFDRRSYRAR